MFALNANMDYINALSFDKGCYIGQEITSRSKFTGVIRKRMMTYLISSKEIIDYDSSKNNLTYMMKYVDINYIKDHSESEIIKKENVNFLLIGNYLNLTFGVMKYSERIIDVFHHDGNFYYRIKIDQFEDKILNYL